jgi:hypothetical protein
MKTQFDQVVMGFADSGKRDAIHAPVILMSLDYREYKNDKAVIWPGDKVTFTSDSTFKLAFTNEFDGIISPFIEAQTYVKGKPIPHVWVMVHPKLLDGTVQHYFQVEHELLTKQIVMSEDEYDECKGCYS